MESSLFKRIELFTDHEPLGVTWAMTAPTEWSPYLCGPVHGEAFGFLQQTTGRVRDKRPLPWG
jgi:hypothetical protein